MREMGQSAWLNTSSLTLQGSEERVNASETGTGCNDWISWGNNYSGWSVIGGLKMMAQRRSAKTKPSRVTISPVCIGTEWWNIGPA